MGDFPDNSLFDEPHENTRANLRALRGIFAGYLEPRHDHYYHHQKLNCRYGIELEFFSSVNRYVIGNRVNSCMYNQNHRWWRNNFNALVDVPVDRNLLQGARRITDNNNNFDEYSSFFVEASENHGSVSHKGDHRCERRGTAGFRIENDGSVEMDNNSGVCVWSLNKENRHQGTDLRAAPPAAGGESPWGADARGLRAGVSTAIYGNNPTEYCSIHSLNHDWMFNGGQDSDLNLSEENELVSNILHNVHVHYPLKNVGGGVYNDRLLPLGGLMIDNMTNHMMAHTTALVTQRSGFHVHLSEYPRIADEDERKAMIIGFVSLFYVFEPLLYSLHPHYRSDITWCQSLQSIFTREEMINYDEEIWNDLTGAQNISEITVGGDDLNHNRKIRGNRYLALNLMNCVPDDHGNPGIGTVEVRLGHVSFDSKYIQAYVHFLQTLFHLNLALIEHGQANGGMYMHHNYLLTTKLMPPYCDSSSEEYTRDDPTFFGIYDNDNNVDLDTMNGIFTKYRDTQAGRRSKYNLIRGLYQLFYALTKSGDTIRLLVPFTNFYHNRNDNWLGIRNFSQNIDAEELIGAANDYLGIAEDVQNRFWPVIIDEDYALGLDDAGNPKRNYLHPCKTCTYLGHACSPDFNDGDYPVNAGERVDDDDQRDESQVYRETCAGRTFRSKTQSELINPKLIGGGFAGGRRKTRKNQNKKLKRKQTYKRKQKGGSTNSKNMATYNPRINEGADRIVMIKKENKIKMARVDWVGSLYTMELLTEIVNKLLDTKVIDEETLEKLVKHRYIDYYVFSKNNQKKLNKELEKYNITPDTITKIIHVYNDKSYKSINENSKYMIKSLPKRITIPESEETSIQVSTTVNTSTPGFTKSTNSKNNKSYSTNTSPRKNQLKQNQGMVGNLSQPNNLQ